MPALAGFRRAACRRERAAQMLAIEPARGHARSVLDQGQLQRDGRVFRRGDVMGLAGQQQAQIGDCRRA